MIATPPVRLTRRVSFSSGHRYWLSALDEQANTKLFGRSASPYNHGHNYVLDVGVEGQVSSDTGMVVNIKSIDDTLQKEIVERFDGKSINDQIGFFANKAPSLENICLYLRDLLGKLDLGGRLVYIRLQETPSLWAELRLKKGWKMTLTRSYEFAASHRLYNPMLSELDNLEAFGKCANRAGHGHNYILEVSISGPLDPRTGMIAELDALDEAVNQTVIERYDHKNLNEDLPEFKERMTTSEEVVLQIWKLLEGRVPGKLERVRLQETARNIFEVSAP